MVAVIPVHVVITTHNRPEDLRDCVAAIAPQVHRVIVIDNASTPPVSTDVTPGIDHLIRDMEQPPNLSRLWNRGIDASARWAHTCDAPLWDTLVLNDDFIAGTGFVDGLQSALRADGTPGVLASPFVFRGIGPRVDFFDTPGTLRSLADRMAGFAWLFKGESGLRLDESIKWLFGDDHVAQSACAAGGRYVVHGLRWEHRHPDGTTTTRPELAEQGGHDRATFVARWGFEPW